MKDPPQRGDFKCAARECDNELPKINGVVIPDPFCSTICCKEYWGIALA